MGGTFCWLHSFQLSESSLLAFYFLSDFVLVMGLGEGEAWWVGSHITRPSPRGWMGPAHGLQWPRWELPCWLPMLGEAHSVSRHSGLAAARGWARAGTGLARAAGQIGEGARGGGVRRGPTSITASRLYRSCQVVVEPGPGANVLGNSIAI